MSAKLYIRDNLGNTRVWSIMASGENLIMKFGIIGGAMQTKVEEVKEGKSTRTQKEQMMSRMASRIKNQIDKGYSRDFDKSLEKPMNALGMPKPMLAQRFDKVKNVDLEYSFLQVKYNGHRCLIGKKDGHIIAYSRNGKLIISIHHILKDLVLEDGQIIDGELYCHGVALQTISSWVKREQDNTKKLKFIAYDIIRDSAYSLRKLELESLNLPSNIILAPTRETSSIASIKSELIDVINQGYEGLIVRQGDNAYEDGKRSKSLIKIKKCFDDEFLVIDVHESVDGWAILECVTKDGVRFRVSSPGNIEKKTFTLNNKHLYIGTYVNVEYFEVTNKGTPFHPVATIWRNKDEE